MGRLLPTLVVHEAIFVATGVLMLVFVLKSEALARGTPTKDSIATHLLFSRLPRTAAIANSVLIFVTFLVAFPALLMHKATRLLQAHAWMVVACAIFTLTLGLEIWISTLRTRKTLSGVWNSEPVQIQGLLESRFECCGFWNSTSPGFVTNDVCPSVFAAAQMDGCVAPFTTYANWYLQILFTTLFGIAVFDFWFLIVTSMVVSWRKEQERQKIITQKMVVPGLYRESQMKSSYSMGGMSGMTA